MTRLRNVGGKITEFTKGNETLYAGNDIVYNAGKPIKFTGEKGILFGKPEKRVAIKVVKVEGPFDESGKLLTEIKAGQAYTYKATPSKTPTAAEVSMLKWAVKLDGGKITEVGAAAAHNQLAEGKIVVAVKINLDFKKAKVYAYFNKADEAVSVAVNGKNKFPMLVLQGSRRKGMNRENTGPALDLLSGDYPENAAGFEKLKKELNAITYKEEPQNKWYNVTSRQDNANVQSEYKVKQIQEYCKKTSDELFTIFKDEIQGIYSYGKVETVAGDMVEKMRRNEGGEYVNKDLTTAVINHGNSIKFIAAIKKVITDHIKENKGNIDKLEITDDGRGELYTRLEEDNVDSPRFGDYFSGLGITINDVWAYKVFIADYTVKGNEFEMKLEYIYYDHFGLDYPDIQKFDKSIFYSWFILQHFRGYKPFITKLEITGPLKGTF